MKNYTLRFRVIDKHNFIDIQSGKKSIETRAGTERYRAVAPGDTLTIVCGKERVVKTINRVTHFKTIGALLKALPLKKIMPDITRVRIQYAAGCAASASNQSRNAATAERRRDDSGQTR